MMSQDEILERWIPYRLESVRLVQVAWVLAVESSKQRRLEVYVDGKVRFEGNVAAITNPMIEVGVIHARALLEFLGLRADKGRLVAVKDRRNSDVGVELFCGPHGTLAKVEPDTALGAYPGPRSDAEDALVSIFELSNKVLAHVTDGLFTKNWTDHHLDIACRGIPVLINNHLYCKLGREMPRSSLSTSQK